MSGLITESCPLESGICTPDASEIQQLTEIIRTGRPLAVIALKPFHPSQQIGFCNRDTVGRLLHAVVTGNLGEIYQKLISTLRLDSATLKILRSLRLICTLDYLPTDPEDPFLNLFYGHYPEKLEWLTTYMTETLYGQEWTIHFVSYEGNISSDQFNTAILSFRDATRGLLGFAKADLSQEFDSWSDNDKVEFFSRGGNVYPAGLAFSFIHVNTHGEISLDSLQQILDSIST